ncbi:MAG: hypothetical protein IPN29_04040 [Saprospiraceae bacterium]|nr:hypothetical protein [Saprospiraceae bacterium]
MKTLIYTMILFITLSSCRSIESMVEKGQYDEAFSHAIDKLAGEKNKKTKYVKGLEKAFRELNARDLRKIEALEWSSGSANWEEIYNLYGRLATRQEKVSPLLPLISSDGYEASFDFKDYLAARNSAREKAVLAYYNRGSEMLDKAKTNRDKAMAREAFHTLSRIDRFTEEYKDVALLKREARDLGIVHIAVDIREDKEDAYGRIFSDKLTSIRLEKLGNEWEKYYLFDKGRNFDKFIVVEMNRPEFGTEKENVNNFELTALVEDGLEYLYDSKGNIVKDSLGHKITVPRKVITKAWVSEIFREKSSRVTGKVLMYDEVKSLPVQNLPVAVYHDFKDSAVRFTGDRRALNTEIGNRLDDHISNFPSDHDAVDILSSNLLSAVESAIRKLNV